MRPQSPGPPPGWSVALVGGLLVGLGLACAGLGDAPAKGPDAVVDAGTPEPAASGLAWPVAPEDVALAADAVDVSAFCQPEGFDPRVHGAPTEEERLQRWAPHFGADHVRASHMLTPFPSDWADVHLIPGVQTTLHTFKNCIPGDHRHADHVLEVQRGRERSLFRRLRTPPFISPDGRYVSLHQVVSDGPTPAVSKGVLDLRTGEFSALPDLGCVEMGVRVLPGGDRITHGGFSPYAPNLRCRIAPDGTLKAMFQTGAPGPLRDGGTLAKDPEVELVVGWDTCAAALLDYRTGEVVPLTGPSADPCPWLDGPRAWQAHATLDDFPRTFDAFGRPTDGRSTPASIRFDEPRMRLRRRAESEACLPGDAPDDAVTRTTLDAPDGLDLAVVEASCGGEPTWELQVTTGVGLTRWGPLHQPPNVDVRGRAVLQRLERGGDGWDVEVELVDLRGGLVLARLGKYGDTTCAGGGVDWADDAVLTWARSAEGVDACVWSVPSGAFLGRVVVSGDPVEVKLLRRDPTALLVRWADACEARLVDVKERREQEIRGPDTPVCDWLKRLEEPRQTKTFATFPRRVR